MSDCGCKDQPKGYEHKPEKEPQEYPDSVADLGRCAPGDLCRNNYYTGKLLTARDFRMEQDYFRDKQRLHNLFLHGWGIVCGLGISTHPKKDCKRIVLHPGLAIDPCGREVRVRCPREFDLPKPPKGKSHKPPCPDDDPPPPPRDQKDPGDQYQQQPPGHEEPYHPRPPQHDDRAIDLYLCISYRECPQEIGPAPFDECGCNGPSQQANKICEEYQFTIHTEKPEWWDAALPERCEDDDCTLIWKRSARCHVPPAFPCIPLAVIHGYIPGEPLDPETIENVSVQLLLPSTTLLKQMIDCIVSKLPLKDYTRIARVNWTHDWDYKCDDFVRLFVGDEKHPESFEIEFTRPLHPDGISKRTFLLTVVFRDRKAEPRNTHVVPAEVELSADRRTVSIKVDRHYVRQYLDRHHFDLYIRIYCDKVLDENGDPVDGDLLAKKMPDDKYMVAPPTGNGVPGGVFDSWILVR